MIPKKSNKKDELNYEVPPISEYFWKISIPLVNYYPHLAKNKFAPLSYLNNYFNAKYS